MSLLLHGQQRAQRPLLLLRRRSVGSTAAAQTDSPATSPTSTSSTSSSSAYIRDTPGLTSVYDPSEMDPFRREPCPISATESESTNESFYHDSPTASDHSTSLTSETTSPLTPSVEGFLDPTIINCSPRRIKHLRPPTPCPELAVLKHKGVVEHNRIQLKIKRLFALAKAGRQHVMEIMNLSKDIESFFNRTPGIIMDNTLDNSKDCPDHPTFPFPEGSQSFCTQSSSVLELSPEDNDAIVNSSTSSYTAQEIRETKIASVSTLVARSKIPRPRLAPLLILKAPSLSTVAACTISSSPSPSPSPTRVRLRPPVMRSFSAPMVFTGSRERSSSSSTQATQVSRFSRFGMGSPKARPSTTYIPRPSNCANTLESPKINLKFEFESHNPGTEKPPLRSRFSSGSTIAPPRRRWYKPSIGFRGSGKDGRGGLRGSSATVSISSPQARPTKVTPPIRECSFENTNSSSFKRIHPGREHLMSMNDAIPPITASGRWSTDWDEVLFQIGRKEGNTREEWFAARSHADSVNPSTISSKDPHQNPQTTASSLPRGSAQKRLPSSTLERFTWRIGGIYDDSAGISTLCTSKTSSRPPSQRPSPHPDSSRASTSKLVQYKVPMSNIVGNLDSSLENSKAAKALSFVSKVSRTSLGPSKSVRSSITFTRPLTETHSSIPRLCRDERMSRGSGITMILGDFPDPPRRVPKLAQTSK